ncbi:MAG: hypothetical protein ACP5O2_11610 [Bacteroidales bacterium]
MEKKVEDRIPRAFSLRVIAWFCDHPVGRGAGVGLGLALLLGLAYFPLLSGTSTLKWDALDCYLPWRWFVAHAWRSDIVPLWNPYQHLGYPIFADLRSVFCLEPYVVAGLGGYSVRLLHLIFLFYLWLGGLGFYRLSGHVLTDYLVRALVAATYMLSGYFVGHGQELFGLTAGALMPWVLFYFIRLQQHKAPGDIFITSLLLVLLLTGGYQALSLILFYLLLILFLNQGIGHLRRHEGAELRRLFLVNAGLLVLTIGALVVLLVAFVQGRPWVARMSGISLQEAWFMPFSPQSLLSLFTPFATVGQAEFWQTDTSMNNLYFGITLLCFLGTGLAIRGSSPLFRILMIFGAVCLLAAMGPYTPVREWLFRYMPLMNLFRMSAWFAWFALLAFILAAGRGLERFVSNPYPHLPGLVVACSLILMGLIAIIYFYSDHVGSALHHMLAGGSMHQKTATSTLGQRFAFNALVQLAIMSGFALIILFSRRWPRLLPWGPAFLILFDLLLSVRLNFYGTVGSEFTISQVQAVLDRAPYQYPTPDLRTPLYLYPDNQRKTAPLWRNTHIFTQTVSAEGFNSFRLDAYENLSGKKPELFAEILRNPLMYGADTIGQWSDTGRITVVRRVAWVEGDRTRLPQRSNGAGLAAELRQFRPGHCSARVQARDTALMIISQAWFPGWEARLDGRPVEILRVNGFQQGVVVPPGIHALSLDYYNPQVMQAWGFSAWVFFILCAIAFFYGLQRTGWSAKYRGLIAGGFSLLLAGMIFYARGRDAEPLSAAQWREADALRVTQQIGDRGALWVSSGGQPYRIDSLIHALDLPLHFFSLGPSPELQMHSLDSMLQRQKPEVVYFWRDEAFRYFSPEDVLRLQYPAMDTLWAGNNRLLLRFHSQGRKKVLYEASLLAGVAAMPEEVQLGQGMLETHPGGAWSYRLDSINKGSPAFRIPIPDAWQGYSLHIVATARVFLSKGAGVSLYFKADVGGRKLYQQGTGSHEKGLPYEQRVFMAQTAEMNFPKGTETPVLQVFLWLDGKKPVWVEELRVGIYP